MFKRVIAVIVIVAVGNLILSGCTKAVRVQPDKVATDRCKVSSVDLVTGEHIDFDQHGGRYNPATQTIDGFDRKGKAVIVKYSQVKQARTKRTYYSGPIMITLLAGLAIFVISEKRI